MASTESFEADVSLRFKTETLELARAEAEALLKALKEIEDHEARAVKGGAGRRLESSTNAMVRAGGLEQRAGGAQQAAEDKQLGDQIRQASRQKLAGDRLAQQMQADGVRQTYQTQQFANRAVLDDLRKKQRDEDAIAREERDARREALRNTRSSFSNKMLRATTNPYALSAMATGNPMPMVFGLGQALAGTFLSPNAGSAGRTGAMNIGAAVAANRLASGAGGAAATAGEDAGIGGLAGIAGRLGAMAAGPAGLVAGAAALVGGGYLLYNSKQSEIYKAQAQLRAGTSGAARVDPRSMYSQILNGGARFFYGADESFGTAAALNAQGINGISQLSGQTQNAMALSRLDPNISLGDATSLVGSMGGAGGMSAEDVAKTIQALNQQLPQTGVSLNRMVASLKDLEDATGGVGLNLNGVNGLAAVQSMLGPTMSAGQIMAPMAGATGAQAFAASAFLGITPDQLQDIQTGKGNTKGVGTLFDLASKRIRAQTAGTSGATRTDLAEVLLQNTGLFNVNNLSAPQQQSLVQALLTGNSAAAKALDLQKHENFMSGGNWRGAVANLAGKETSDVDQAKIALLTGILNAINHNTDELDKAFHLNRPTVAQKNAARGRGVNSTILAPEASVGDPSSPMGWVWDHVLGWLPGMSSGTPSGSGTHTSRLGSSAIGGNATSASVPNGRGVNDKISGALLKTYEAASKHFGVPLALLLAQGARESDFNPNAVNPSGAAGIAQFMPATWKYLMAQKDSPFYGKKASPMNASQAIAMQAYYDKQLMAHGGMGAAISGYGDQTAGYNMAVADSVVHITITIQDPAGNKLGSATHTHKVTGRGKAGARDHLGAMGQLWSQK